MSTRGYTVTAIDMGCDCCSYVPVNYFYSRVAAERWVDSQPDKSNFEIEPDDEGPEATDPPAPGRDTSLPPFTRDKDIIS